LVNQIRILLPSTKLGLITNGTTFPEGDWYKEIEWARISIDSATRKTFKDVRQKDFFNEVCGNLLRFIETPIRCVGVTFLYSHMNIHEYVPMINFFYHFIKKESFYNMKKLTIQFRPLRQDPKDEGQIFPEAITKKEIDLVVQELLTIASTNEEMFNFIKSQTNSVVVKNGNLHKPLEFTRCHYALIFHILRANGDLYPCFITVDQPSFLLGNLITDSLETIALNSIYIAGKLQSTCNPEQCRQCHVNNLLERGLTGDIPPSISHDVQTDPFF
jgi:radical SAM protein with 4Fe4S-binding SPASM domain